MKHEFIEFIPESLEDGILYISIPHATAIHKCACGCGEETVTPFSPTDWKMTFDGESISLWPSIGNWNFKCRSHYWISNSRVCWAEQWSRERVEAGRRYDRLQKNRQYEYQRELDPLTTFEESNEEAKNRNTFSLINWLTTWFQKSK